MKTIIDSKELYRLVEFDTNTDTRIFTLARELIRLENLKRSSFPKGMIFDPAWNILLDLFVRHSENRVTSVTSACGASGVPMTTALRYIQAMELDEMLRRQDDDRDERRKHLLLTPKSVRLVQRVLSQSLQG
jgi:DNA-binding MarR family transcriptional regulator